MGELPSLCVAGVQLFCGFMCHCTKELHLIFFFFFYSVAFLYFIIDTYIVALFSFTWVPFLYHYLC